jgi:hypothetical protein
VAVLIALAGAGLLAHQWAGARPLWLDEEMVALNLRDRALADLAGPLWLGQSAPLGWLTLQRGALLTFGTSEHAMRLVPVLFGVGTLATAVWIGLRWMGPVGAAALTILCSCGQWLSLYSLELKQYSADMSWGLLLPALAVWAMEPAADVPASHTRRAAVWWAVAAIGHWFAHGALLVAPACSVVLCVMLWRRAGRRSAFVFALLGLGWLASFGLHYVLVLRDTLGSEYLRDYWSFALPPASAGLGGTLGWLASQLQPFALKPGGATLWPLFWLAAASGFVVGGRPRLGLVLATVPLSAFVLAGIRLVPLYERLSLWVVPSLYAGVALLIDAAVRLGLRAHARGKEAGVAVALVVGLVGFVVCYDIYWNGREDMRLGRPSDSNHQLNDRAAVRWLMAERQPGDVLMTSHLALPALWWYGGIPLATAEGAGSRQQDGSPVLEVSHVDPGPGCRPNELRDALKDRRRVLVYFGFRFDDMPRGFDDLVLHHLAELGTITANRSFGDAGRAAVIDLHPSANVSRPVTDSAGTRPGDAPARPNGCLTVRPARRW